MKEIKQYLATLSPHIRQRKAAQMLAAADARIADLELALSRALFAAHTYRCFSKGDCEKDEEAAELRRWASVQAEQAVDVLEKLNDERE